MTNPEPIYRWKADFAMGIVTEAEETARMEHSPAGFRLSDLKEGERLIVHTTRGATFSANAEGEVRYGKGKSGVRMGKLSAEVSQLVPGKKFVYRLSDGQLATHITRAVHVYRGARDIKLSEIWTLAGGYQQQTVCASC